jgi:hypothetical protein
MPIKIEKYNKWEHNWDIRETLREIKDILSRLNNLNS